MICPNCGASNSTKATFCRRCHQRLPVAGLAAGVTYPRRRVVASGNNRLPIIAALALAIVGLVIGVLLVSLLRPNGSTTPPIAGVSPSPISSLPTFTSEAVTPSPSASPPPIETFPGLPTPLPSPTIGPSPIFTPTPTPSIEPTPTPTNVTPPPSRTPRPTPTPTDKPTPTPTPTDTPTIASCANATGNATDSVTIGFGNHSRVRSTGWCIDSVSFQIVFGSTWGTVSLLRDGTSVASFSCNNPDICSDPSVTTFAKPKLARVAALLQYATSCAGDPNTPEDECAVPDAFRATITINYERATIGP